MRSRHITTDIAVLSIIIIVTVLASIQIPKIRINSSTDVFIPKEHEISKINDRITEEFGAVDSILLGVHVNFGTVLEPEVLTLIDTLTERLESNSYVKRVISLTNADFIESYPEGMEVVPLIGDFSRESLRLLNKRIVESEDLYLGTLISRDTKMGVIVIQPEPGLSELENRALYDGIRMITDGYKNSNISFPIVGYPVVNREIELSVSADITYLIPLVAVLILIILFFSFRRIEGVVLPLLALVAACIWVVGVMGALGFTFTMASLLVPVLLLVVGSAYGIHVMSQFYGLMSRKTGFLPFDEVLRIIRRSLGNIRLSVILAGATTAAGFLSQLSSPLGPFRAFGVLSALGVLFSQVGALVLIPLLLRLRYRRGIDTDRFHKRESVENRLRTPGIFILFEKIVRRKKMTVILFSLVFVAAAAVFIPRINLGTNMINFFQSRSRMVRDTNTFNDELGGTGIISVLIEAPDRGDILSPGFLHNLEGFEEYIQLNHHIVSGVQTLVPFIKRINKVLNADRTPYEKGVEEEGTFDFFSDNWDSGDTLISETPGVENSPGDRTETGLTYEEMAGRFEEAFLDSGIDGSTGEFIESFLSIGNYNGAAFDEIPMEPEKYGLSGLGELEDLLSQYMMLYSGNLDMIINDGLEPDKTLVTLQVREDDSGALTSLRSDIREFWKYHLPDEWKISIGGGTALSLVLSELVLESQYYSLLGALLIVWLIVALMFRSPVAGLFGMIPVVFAVLGIFLFMGIFGFNLDIVTSLLASLAIGIGVDYAIHFMNAYKRSVRDKDANSLNTVYRTTGKAIFFNALSVAVGFTGLLISRFVPIRQLGILFSVSMLLSGGASLIVLPLCIELIKPRFLFGKEDGSVKPIQGVIHEKNEVPDIPVLHPDDTASAG